MGLLTLFSTLNYYSLKYFLSICCCLFECGIGTQEEEPIYVQDEAAGAPESVAPQDLLRVLQEYEFEYSQRQLKVIG